MESIRARGRDKGHLRGAEPKGGAAVRCGDSKLAHLVEQQQIWQKVQRVVAKKVVLNVDAIDCDIGERAPLAVDHRAPPAVSDSSLRQDQRQGAAAKSGKLA